MVRATPGAQHRLVGGSPTSSGPRSPKAGLARALRRHGPLPGAFTMTGAAQPNGPRVTRVRGRVCYPPRWAVATVGLFRPSSRGSRVGLRRTCRGLCSTSLSSVRARAPGVVATGVGHNVMLSVWGSPTAFRVALTVVESVQPRCGPDRWRMNAREDGMSSTGRWSLIWRDRGELQLLESHGRRRRQGRGTSKASSTTWTRTSPHTETVARPALMTFAPRLSR